MRTNPQPGSDARRAAYAAYNWMTVAEVAAELRAHGDFVRDRIHAPCTCRSCKSRPETERFRFKEVIRKGRDYLIDPDEVRRYVREHRVNSEGNAK